MTDNLDIPDFLLRNKGESVTVSNNATVPAVEPDTETDRAAEIRRAGIAAMETWLILEQQRNHRKAKARGRVAKMLAIKADRNAAKTGKTWNTNKGRWE